MTGGDTYVKVYRRLEDSAVFKNPLTLKVFLWALIRATYKSRVIRFGGRDITLQPGQFISGRFVGAEACHMPASTFRNQIARLRELQILDSVSDNEKTVFTVVNWARYQGSPFGEDNKKNSQRTAGGHKQEGKKERRKGNGGEELPEQKPLSEPSSFITFFCLSHEEHRKSKYAVQRGKDHAAAKSMIDSLGLEECKARAVRYLNREDKWTHEHGFSIGNMLAVINGLGGNNGYAKSEEVPFLTFEEAGSR